jgi:hypothetical protein
MQVQSADGVMHEFPDGTNDAIIDKAMKAYVQGKPVTLGDVGNQALADVKAIPGKLWDMVAGIPKLPARMGEVATEYGKTGEYNPAPFMEAAALTSPVNPAIRAGDKIVPGVAKAVTGQKAVPTAPELVAEADKNYSRARTAGVEFNPLIFKDWARNVSQELETAGRIDAPTSAAGTHDILRRFQNVPQADGARTTQTITNIDAFRQSLSDIANDFGKSSKSDRAAATIALRKLDEFIPTLGPQDTLAGAAALPYALEQIGKGRGNTAAAKRSNLISGDLDRAHTGIIERADDAAASANSGQNVGNALRQRIKNLLASKENLNGFAPQEIAQAERINKGTRGMNYSRGVANFMGGGGGLGAQTTSALSAALGAAGGGVPGAALGATMGPVIGVSAKALENSLTRKQVQGLDELLRKRSPLYEGAPTNYTVASPESRAALIRALMLGQQQQ